jgi:DNA mismatch endonuclease (patch repair protein)
MPKSRIAFWRRKFRENVARDERNRREVRAAGWRPLTVWECQVNDERHLKRLLKEIVGGRQ